MQTQILNTTSMAGLGCVLPFGIDFQDEAVLMDFHMDKPQMQYTLDSNVTLDFESGMALLVLYSPEGPLVFYFDHPVQLFSGTTFSIVPLNPICTIRLYLAGNSPIQGREIQRTFPFSPTPLLQVTQIYTCFYQEKSSNFYFRGEKHHPYELTYVEQGCLHNLVNGNDIILQQGDLLIIDRDNWHTQYSDAPVTFLTVAFDLSNDLLEDSVNKCLRVPSSAQFFLTRFLQERATNIPFSYDYLISLLNILLIELLRSSTTPASHSRVLPSTLRSEHRIMNDALQIITHRCHNPLSLKELAASVHVSVPYICRLFQTHLGMPPGEYINKIRLEECKFLLCQGELSMGEIAAHMNFSSPQQFSRQFRHYCGMTPSEYAKAHRII